jgi:hypothetical protein
MKARLLVLSLATTCFIFSFCQRSDAVPPWLQMVRFKRIEADPNQVYTLARENGPWMIMATTFRGPQAAQDARQLVLELRRDFKLPAFQHAKVFDFSQSFAGRGVDEYGQPLRMRHQTDDRIEEVAVLIGNYAAVDDPQAQRDLQKVKTAHPRILDGSKSQTFSQMRDIQKNWGKNPNKRGPMRMAFITANPMLPEEYYRPRGIDKFVEKLNRGLQHTLLECPGNYSVRVATFTGCAVVDPTRIRDFERGKEWSYTRLEKAANKAHKLVVGLRAKGYEAYEFHDRNSSIVTVGSFYRPPAARVDGTSVYEPQVQQLIQRFGAKRKMPSAVAGVNHPGVVPGVQPESLLGVPFDMHPTLIQVPKRSIANDYAGALKSLR